MRQSSFCLYSSTHSARGLYIQLLGRVLRDLTETECSDCSGIAFFESKPLRAVFELEIRIMSSNKSYQRQT